MIIPAFAYTHTYNSYCMNRVTTRLSIYVNGHRPVAADLYGSSHDATLVLMNGNVLHIHSCSFHGKIKLQ